MTVEHVRMMTTDGVHSLAKEWFGVDVEMDVADEIATRFNSILEEWEPSHNCLSPSAISTGALIWLKSRLMESGMLRPGLTDWPELRLFCLLHMPSLEVPEEEIDQWRQRPNYARSRISRSPLACIEPIDAVAARMVKIQDNARCRECGKYFRNAAAHRLHLAEGMCRAVTS